MRDIDAQLMVEAQWGTDDSVPPPRQVVQDPDYKGGHADLLKTTGYLLDLSTQKLTPLNGRAIMTLTQNLKPVDSDGGVTYAYDNFIVVIPNPER